MCGLADSYAATRLPLLLVFVAVTHVRGVLTDQGSDISGWLNEVAGDFADSYTGVLIAESGLNEWAFRDTKWPDYSAGLSQVIAANLGYGTYLTRPSPTLLAAYKARMFQPENAIREGWRWYGAALAKHHDPLWAALAYNVGNTRSTDELKALVAKDPLYARRLEHYRVSLEAAGQYREVPTMDTYAIGEGVRAKMAEYDDAPRSDERYQQQDPLISMTFARDAIYVYLGEDNAVRRIPFE